MVGLGIKMERKCTHDPVVQAEKWRPRSANQGHAIIKFLDLNEPADKQKVPLAQVPVKRKC